MPDVGVPPPPQVVSWKMKMFLLLLLTDEYIRKRGTADSMDGTAIYVSSTASELDPASPHPASKGHLRLIITGSVAKVGVDWTTHNLLGVGVDAWSKWRQLLGVLCWGKEVGNCWLPRRLRVDVRCRAVRCGAARRGALCACVR